LQVFEIGDKVFWCFGPTGFVGVVGFVAKCGCGEVKGDRHVFWFLGRHDFQQRLEKAETDAGGNAGAGSQTSIPPFGKGKVGTKGQRVAVN